MIQSERIALITGACGGIGSAMVEVFMAAGYHVIATDFKESLDILGDYTYIQMDLDKFSKSSDYAAEKIEEIMSIIGDKGINVMINNAAIQILGGVDELTRENWNLSLNINLTAPFLLTQTLVKQLEKVNGSVINISSIHARLTKKGFVAYATTKAALSGMTKAMAVDLGDRVRVNAIEPAAIETPMLLEGFKGKDDQYYELKSFHPQNRIGRPQEVANLALLISRDKLQFIHGAIISLDGGISGRLHDPV